MRPDWRRVTAPSKEPVSLEEAKEHLRVDHSAEDMLIAALITTAREQLEELTGRAFITQGWQLALPWWPAASVIRLPRPPALAVSAITYVDEDGAAHTMSSSDYSVVTTVEPGCVVLTPDGDWPSATLYTGLPITVAYTCGYGTTPGNVPAPLRAAMLLTIGHLYTHREAVVTGTISSVLPMTVDYLIAPYRLNREEYP